MKKYFMALAYLLMLSPSLMLANAANIPQTAMETALQKMPPVVAKTPEFDANFLAPVDGVDFSTFALAAYDAFYRPGDVNTDAAFQKKYGFTKVQYDTAEDEFSKRMVEDETYTLMNIYGAYYFQNADKDSRKYADYAKDYVQSVLNDGPLFEKEPMTLEEYSDLIEFYDSNVDEDEELTREQSDAILKEKGMSFLDLQIIGAWLGREASLNMN